MLSNLGTEGMAAEDGPGPAAVPYRWDQCFLPHGTGAGPTEEGVCYWLTRLKRHKRDTERASDRPPTEAGGLSLTIGICTLSSREVVCERLRGQL